MSDTMSRDFASLLDDMLKAAPQPEDPGPRPTMPFGVTTPLDAVDAFWSSVSSEFVAGLYNQTAGVSPPAAGPDLQPVQPDRIAAELGLDRPTPPKNLDRLRRAFAFKNHPDRMPAEQRERAMLRMQVANRLIDEAKQAGSSVPVPESS